MTSIERQLESIVESPFQKKDWIDENAKTKTQIAYEYGLATADE